MKDIRSVDNQMGEQAPIEEVIAEEGVINSEN